MISSLDLMKKGNFLAINSFPVESVLYDLSCILNLNIFFDLEKNHKIAKNDIDSFTLLNFIPVLSRVFSNANEVQYMITSNRKNTFFCKFKIARLLKCLFLSYTG